MDNNFSIGKRIRELRLQNHLSQEQLAFSADITTAYLGQLERNEKNPTVMVLMKICAALGIEISDFFSEKTFQPKEIDYVSAQIMQLIRELDEDMKIQILQLIKLVLKIKKM